MPGRVRVFIACSLDGFIAGPDDQLDWLTTAVPEVDTFHPFMASVGSLLMGRRTYEALARMDVEWPYGEAPVLVATHRALDPIHPSVRPVSGPIGELVALTLREAGDRDVYLDGGGLIRAALDEGLVDELCVTIAPSILGRGLPLFAGVKRPRSLTLQDVRDIGGGLVQLTYLTEPTNA